jgi:hypothetical protein
MDSHFKTITIGGKNSIVGKTFIVWQCVTEGAVEELNWSQQTPHLCICSLIHSCICAFTEHL